MNKDKFQTRATRYFRSTKERILVTPKQGLFNYRCFENAIEFTRLNPNHEVYEVIYIEGSTAILHYINRDSLTGEFLETTLGFRADYFEYYLIRKIPEIDYKYLGSEFDKNVEFWTNKFSSWWERKLFKIDRLV